MGDGDELDEAADWRFLVEAALTLSVVLRGVRERELLDAGAAEAAARRGLRLGKA